MGHSQLEKQRTHDRIVEIASRRLREKGLEGIGVADLMKEAGLTVGGFYKHFASRDDMVAEAMKLAFGSWEATVRSQGRAPADIPMAEYSANYLSEDHRNDVSGGCTGLRYGDPVVSKTYSSQLCRGDILRTFSPGTPNMPSGSCALNSFVPYTR